MKVKKLGKRVMTSDKTRGGDKRLKPMHSESNQEENEGKKVEVNVEWIEAKKKMADLKRYVAY